LSFAIDIRGSSTASVDVFTVVVVPLTVKSCAIVKLPAKLTSCELSIDIAFVPALLIYTLSAPLSIEPIYIASLLSIPINLILPPPVVLLS